MGSRALERWGSDCGVRAGVASPCAVEWACRPSGSSCGVVLSGSEVSSCVAQLRKDTDGIRERTSACSASAFKIAGGFSRVRWLVAHRTVSSQKQLSLSMNFDSHLHSNIDSD